MTKEQELKMTKEQELKIIKEQELKIIKEHLYNLLTSETAHLRIWYEEEITEMEREIKRLEKELKKNKAPDESLKIKTKRSSWSVGL